MILISLLPEQHKVKSKAPIKHLLGVAAAVTVNTLLVAWLGWTYFGVSAEVQSELQVLQDTNEGLKAQVAYHKELDTESDKFASREKTLGEITMARIPWTKKLDELVDLSNRGGDGEKYLVWFNDLNVTQKRDKRRGTSGSLRASGFSGSNQFAHVANFLEDIEEDKFGKTFTRPAPPEGSAQNVDPELMPQEVWNFSLELGIKSPVDRLDPDDPRRQAALAAENQGKKKKKRKKGAK